VKLLFDDNLSWRLEKLLSAIFPGSKHIRNIPSLSTPASDTEIWNFALKSHFIIVTNNDDFYKLAMARDKCPKIIIIGESKKTPISALRLPQKYSCTLVHCVFWAFASLDLGVFLKSLAVFL